MKRSLLLILLLCIPLAHALQWSEILFDAQGNDNGKEFVELIGDEDLSGCTISDSASSDTLELLHAEANDIILIVESDGTLNETRGATVYGAGKAIGNGLGNAYETLTIACDDTLLETSYNVSDLPDFEPGESIVWDDGWTLGPQNGTPGSVDSTAPKERPDVPRQTQKPACNSTLAITLGAIEGDVNDTISFSIISAQYASWKAEANESIFAYGDTLTQDTFSITLPQTHEVRIVASSDQCSGTQRAVRIVRVRTPKRVAMTQQTPLAQNLTPDLPAPISAPTIRPPPPPPPLEDIDPPIVTGKVVVDEDRDTIPWIASFGMVTLVVSLALFYLEKRL